MAAAAKSRPAEVSSKSRSDHRWFLPVLAELKLILSEKIPGKRRRAGESPPADL
jgi:hypothetical protein